MLILVTGAAGMLGSVLVPILRSRGHEVIASDITNSDAYLDVRSPHNSRWISRGGFDLVIHLAAITSLEDCEADPDNAWHTNALGTRYIAQICRSLDIPMLYVSTAGIFDGTSQSLYTEFDQPNPGSVYGHSKLAGERAVAALERHWICRAGWMMSGGPAKDKKFVSLIVGQLKAGVTAIRAASDLQGSPTYGPDFSRGIASLIMNNNYGLYHMACGESASRYDVAVEIVGGWVSEHPGKSVVITPVPSREFEVNGFPAPRPRNEAIRNMVLELEGQKMRGWQEALAEYMKEWV